MNGGGAVRQQMPWEGDSLGGGSFYIEATVADHAHRDDPQSGRERGGSGVERVVDGEEADVLFRVDLVVPLVPRALACWE